VNRRAVRLRRSDPSGPNERYHGRFDGLWRAALQERDDKFPNKIQDHERIGGILRAAGSPASALGAVASRIPLAIAFSCGHRDVRMQVTQCAGYGKDQSVDLVVVQDLGGRFPNL
jgi:hypothetical protein